MTSQNTCSCCTKTFCSMLHRCRDSSGVCKTVSIFFFFLAHVCLLKAVYCAESYTRYQPPSVANVTVCCKFHLRSTSNINASVGVGVGMLLYRIQQDRELSKIGNHCLIVSKSKYLYCGQWQVENAAKAVPSEVLCAGWPHSRKSFLNIGLCSYS